MIFIVLCSFTLKNSLANYFLNTIFGLRKKNLPLFGGLLLATRIRLTRRGRTHQPVYRVVVADGRAPRDGKFLEQVGFFDPTPSSKVLTFDAQAVVKWLSTGAQPSERVWKLLKQAGVDKMWEAFKAGQDISNFELVPVEPAPKTKKLGPKAKARIEAEKAAAAEAEAAAAAPAEEAEAEEAPAAE